MGFSRGRLERAKEKEKGTENELVREMEMER